jgi:hypothetical protein
MDVDTNGMDPPPAGGTENDEGEAAAAAHHPNIYDHLQPQPDLAAKKDGGVDPHTIPREGDTSMNSANDPPFIDPSTADTMGVEEELTEWLFMVCKEQYPRTICASIIKTHHIFNRVMMEHVTPDDIFPSCVQSSVHARHIISMIASSMAVGKANASDTKYARESRGIPFPKGTTSMNEIAATDWADYAERIQLEADKLDRTGALRDIITRMRNMYSGFGRLAE